MYIVFNSKKARLFAEACKVLYLNYNETQVLLNISAYLNSPFIVMIFDIDAFSVIGKASIS